MGVAKNQGVSNIRMRTAEPKDLLRNMSAFPSEGLVGNLAANRELKDTLAFTQSAHAVWTFSVKGKGNWWREQKQRVVV